MDKPAKKPSLPNTVKRANTQREAVLSSDDSSYAHFMEAATMLDPVWMDDAACTELESNDFFPLNANHHDPSLLVAKTCQACPVRKECFDTISAMEGGRWYSSRGQRGKGFFAGLNPSSRNDIYRQPKEQWFDLATTKLNVFIIMKEATNARAAKRQASVGKKPGRPRKVAN
jgi:hypothetical protein